MRVEADRPSDRGQSAVVGVSLLLAITVMTSGLIVTVGGDAFDGIQEQTGLERAEHTMTLFDSRGAMAALGDAKTQEVDFGRAGSGSYEVKQDAGWIRIEHLNYTAERPPNNETVYNRSLGAFLYEQGDRTIAYQGGGVWRLDDENTTMASPPEFHYRDATLTLPVVRTRGTDSAGGRVTATISPTSTARRVFPNGSTPTVDDPGSPYDVTERSYRNPVKNGTVRVTVKSRFYQGWAEYFRTRTEGNVSVDHDARRAVVDLETVGGTMGTFEMPSHGEGIEVRAIDQGHPLTSYQFSLQDSSNSNFFKNMYWSFYAENGPQKFEILVYSPDKQQCTNSKFADLTVGVYYTNGTVSHEWENTSVTHDSGDIRVVCSDLDGDGKDEPRIQVDVAGDTDMRYKEIAGTPPDKWNWDPSGSASTTATWDEHGTNVGYESGGGVTYVRGSGEESLGEVTNHYLSLMGPNYDLKVSETSPSGQRVDESESYGTITYEQGPGSGYITYLHITENEIEIRLD